MSALPTLLHGLIDYAGLFPPAKLPMTDAVRNHADYLRGPHAGALGRFIVPLARLTEFEAAHARLAPAAQAGWQLSALAGDDPAADATVIRDFNSRHPSARIVSLETKAATPADVARLIAPFPSDFEIWVEVPGNSDAPAFIAALKATRGATGARPLGAKIRTGGVTASAFPAPADVARFMLACREAGVPFKTTAGLHHPLRGEFALTYEPGSPRGVMFGFLNVFLAAALVHTGGSEADAGALLGEMDAAAFAVSADVITWRGRRFTTAQLAATRQNFARSFGSCSFTEPIEGLQALRWL
ncbi:MAG: hypothetical protein HYV95_17850 [Opitutae bacterium]|nr:hypothetical protein [Opitutae bacterium]